MTGGNGREGGGEDLFLGRPNAAVKPQLSRSEQLPRDTELSPSFLPFFLSPNFIFSHPPLWITFLSPLTTTPPPPFSSPYLSLPLHQPVSEQISESILSGAGHVGWASLSIYTSPLSSSFPSSIYLVSFFKRSYLLPLFFVLVHFPLFFLSVFVLVVWDLVSLSVRPAVSLRGPI